MIAMRSVATFMATCLFGAMLTCTAAAQTPPDTVPTVIRAGRIFDSEKGTMSGPQEILVAKGRIVEVASRVNAPKGARVVDLSKYTVLPGLIDAHTHLLYLEDPRNGGALEGVKAVSIEGTPLRACMARRGRGPSLPRASPPSATSATQAGSAMWPSGPPSATEAWTDRA